MVAKRLDSSCFRAQAQVAVPVIVERVMECIANIASMMCPMLQTLHDQQMLMTQPLQNMGERAGGGGGSRGGAREGDQFVT